jgi:hypothetical protein
MRALGLAVAGAAVVLMTTGASANDRATRTAVGAVAGAVVAGPVGLVGGGLIGYFAGRQISCDLGIERCRRYVRYRRSSYAPDGAPRRVERAEPGERFRGPGDLGTREDHGNY